MCRRESPGCYLDTVAASGTSEASPTINFHRFEGRRVIMQDLKALEAELQSAEWFPPDICRPRPTFLILVTKVIGIPPPSH
jgi:hypothetical protein